MASGFSWDESDVFVSLKRYLVDYLVNFAGMYEAVHSGMPHIFRVKADLDLRSRQPEAFRNFDAAAGPARIAETDTYTALPNLNFDQLHVLEMIKGLPDQATQHRLLEEFETSRSSVMPTVKELKKMKSELRKIERDADVAGQSLASDGSPELRIIDMPEENNVPAEKHKSSEEAGKSVADSINDGGLVYLTSSSTVKELKKMKSKLRKIDRDTDAAGQILPSDGLPEIRIDMPKENNDPAEKHKSSEEAGKSIADRINEGGLAYLTSSTTNFTGPPWLRTAMDAARLLAYVSTAAGYGTRAYNEKLSQFLSKVGALAVSAVVIAWLAMPLPPVMTWIVGLAAWLITAAAVFFN